MKQITAALFVMSCVASAQSFEQPRQQIDFYGGGSYRVGVGGASVFGTQVRQNFGKLVGVGGFYNFSREYSIFGTNATGFDVSSSRTIHDYGAAVEIHAPHAFQPYVIGTLGGITQLAKGEASGFGASAKVTIATSHIAYGGGVGVRCHFSPRVAVFAESRLLRAAVADSDYWVRGTVGFTVTLP